MVMAHAGVLLTLYLLDKFKRESKDLRLFANKLTAHDFKRAKRRPSLLEWASSSNGAFWDVATAGTARKASPSEEGSAAAIRCFGSILRVRVTRKPRIYMHCSSGRF